MLALSLSAYAEITSHNTVHNRQRHGRCVHFSSTMQGHYFYIITPIIVSISSVSWWPPMQWMLHQALLRATSWTHAEQAALVAACRAGGWRTGSTGCRSRRSSTGNAKMAAARYPGRRTSGHAPHSWSSSAACCSRGSAAASCLSCRSKRSHAVYCISEAKASWITHQAVQGTNMQTGLSTA